MPVRVVRPGERGVDFSYSKPPARRLRELGYTFVVGYISNNPSKDLLLPSAYLNEGLAVIFVCEISATRPNGGAVYGTADGNLARTRLIQLGYPTSCTVIAAFDTNTTSVNIAQHKAYFEAFKAAAYPYQVGAYEDTDLAKITNAEETIDWLPLAWSWSGSSQNDARAKAIDLGYHVFQEKGFWIDNLWAVDPNIVVRPFIAWGNPLEEVEPMKPYIFQLASGGIGIRHESGARWVNGGELEGPLKGEPIYQIPADSNWEIWVLRELGKYERELDPLVIPAPVVNVPPVVFPSYVSTPQK